MAHTLAHLRRAALLAQPRTAQERELLQRPFTEDVQNIPPQGAESVLTRADDSVGGVFTSGIRGLETARDTRFERVRQAQLRAIQNRPAQLRAQRQAQQEARANAQSKRILQDREGRAKLAAAAAALRKARGGGDKLGTQAAELLGIKPRFVGGVSPATARAGARLKETREARQQRETRLSKEKENKFTRRATEVRELAEQLKIPLTDEQIFALAVRPPGGEKSFLDKILEQIFTEATPTSPEIPGTPG